MKTKKHNFFISNQEFYAAYCDGYVKLYAIVNHERYYIADCQNLGFAKYRAKIWLGIA